MSRQPQVSVIGTSTPDEEIYELARAVGRGLAEAGAVVVCGGLGGVMEAVALGAGEAGGITIGVLPYIDPGDANPHVTHAIATGIGQARNIAVVGSGDAVIAVGGAWGTLSEIALARRMDKPVVALRSWELEKPDGSEPGITRVESAEAAVAEAISCLGNG
ncbi:MAG: TIGR00725 family protein [Solirubrobacterales bacterium]|nr:TIGR00725 family protein [Solirubrobacterales bacterium]